MTPFILLDFLSHPAKMDGIKPPPSDDDLPALEEIIQYHFVRHSLLREAVHAAGTTGYLEGNKVLAMIGSDVLRLNLAKQGHDKHQCRGKQTSTPP